MLFFSGFVAALGLITSSSPSEPQALRSFLDQLAIPAGYRVTFEDQDGSTVTFEQFQDLMAYGAFDVKKETAAHHAIVKIESNADATKARQIAAAAKALPSQGQPFPDFRAATLDGTPVSQGSLRGKAFVASFFFAQCAPCIAETPALSAFHRNHPTVAVVAFTFDNADTARRFAQDRHFNWPIVPDQARLAEQAKVTSYPTIMLVDATGRVTKAAHSDALAMPGRPLTSADVERWAFGNPRVGGQ
jgi:peroxiredoxin